MTCFKNVNNETIILFIIIILTTFLMFINLTQNKYEKNLLLEIEQVTIIKTTEDNNQEHYIIETEVVEEKFKKSTYKSDLVFWKGYQLGFLTLKNGEKLTIKISSYGNFFSIDGVQGYYEMNLK